MSLHILLNWLGSVFSAGIFVTVIVGVAASLLGLPYLGAIITVAAITTLCVVTYHTLSVLRCRYCGSQLAVSSIGKLSGGSVFGANTTHTFKVGCRFCRKEDERSFLRGTNSGNHGGGD